MLPWQQTAGVDDAHLWRKRTQAKLKVVRLCWVLVEFPRFKLGILFCIPLQHLNFQHSLGLAKNLTLPQTGLPVRGSYSFERVLLLVAEVSPLVAGCAECWIAWVASFAMSLDVSGRLRLCWIARVASTMVCLAVSVCLRLSSHALGCLGRLCGVFGCLQLWLSLVVISRLRLRSISAAFGTHANKPAFYWGFFFLFMGYGAK